MSKRMRMKGMIISLLVCTCFAGLRLDAEKQVENSALPSGKGAMAGKTVQLRELMRISDTEGDYYLKYPYLLKVAPDGSIFVCDEDQLLKFTPRGEFVGNFFKRGQGPGELVYITNYIFRDNRLIIHDNGQQKIVETDMEGKLVKEFRCKPGSEKTLVYVYNDRYYFVEQVPPDTGGKLEIIDVEHRLTAMSPDGPDGEISREKLRFPVRFLNLRLGRSFIIQPRAKIIIKPFKPGLLFFSHTPHYQIKLLDLQDENPVILKFRRKYNRVKATAGTKKYAYGGNSGKISIGGGQFYQIPVAKFLDDIQAIFLFGNNLWVVTSTVDKSKGILIDVFNREGRYIDNLYLKYPGHAVSYHVDRWLYDVYGEFFFAIEQVDGEWSLVKYKVDL